MNRFSSLVFLVLLLLLIKPVLAADPSTNGGLASPDPAVLAQEQRVKKIFNGLIAEIKKDPGEYSISVEKSAVLNAHAGLGKTIVVNSALAETLSNDTALAFVIAHELGHVEGHHVAKHIARTGIFAIIKNKFFPVSNLYDGVNYLGGLQFSRGAEKKADIFAVKLMNKLYCNQPGKLEFFKKISANGVPPKIMEYLTTHPLPTTRIEYLEKAIVEAGCKP